MDKIQLENICYDVLKGLINIIETNRQLRKENEELKEKLQIANKNLEDGFEAHNRTIEQFMNAVYDGKIKINDFNTV